MWFQVNHCRALQHCVLIPKKVSYVYGLNLVKSKIFQKIFSKCFFIRNDLSEKIIYDFVWLKRELRHVSEKLTIKVNVNSLHFIPTQTCALKRKPVWTESTTQHTLKIGTGKIVREQRRYIFVNIDHTFYILWSSGKGQARKGKERQGWQKVKGLKALPWAYIKVGCHPPPTTTHHPNV